MSSLQKDLVCKAYLQERGKDAIELHVVLVCISEAEESLLTHSGSKQNSEVTFIIRH